MTQLPASWALCAFSDVTAPVATIGTDASTDREIAYIDISSIDNVANKIGEPKRLWLSNAPSRARQIVKAGDVLFSTVRPYLRNIAQVPDALDGQIASTGFAVLRAAEGIVPAYLFYKAISRDFVAALTGEQYGVSYPAVKEEQVRSQPFELPPTREQHRIVAKIEELFSELDKAVEGLTLARAQLKTYRQALLKAAFEGKLTADWRAANPDKLEPPETLLARIRAERETRYKQAVEDWQTAFAEWRASGEVGRKPQKPGRPRDLSANARNGAGAAPWPEVELGDVIAVSSGEGLTSAEMRAGSYPVYGGNGIAGYHDEFILSEPKLVIGRVGAKCGVTHITLPKAWITDNALIVRPLIDSFEMRFFKYLLEYMNLNALGSSTGQPVISGSKIYGQTIALPSRDEQAAAADLIETGETAVRSTEGEIDDALVRIAALRQSILKQAFSGQLVPQDSADEPAAALLARRREQTPAPRTRRRKTT